MQSFREHLEQQLIEHFLKPLNEVPAEELKSATETITQLYPPQAKENMFEALTELQFDITAGKAVGQPQPKDGDIQPSDFVKMSPEEKAEYLAKQNG